MFAMCAYVCVELTLLVLRAQEKLLVCLPQCKHVVLTTWVTDSFRAGQWLPEAGSVPSRRSLP